jgi:hypothetical protein
VLFLSENTHGLRMHVIDMPLAACIHPCTHALAKTNETAKNQYKKNRTVFALSPPCFDYDWLVPCQTTSAHHAHHPVVRYVKHIWSSVHACACVNVCMYVCVCRSVCVSVCMRVRMRIRMRVRMGMHVYTQLHRWIFLAWERNEILLDTSSSSSCSMYLGAV